MKIALVQVNPKVGDFERNTRLVLDRAREASAAGAEVAVFPEMVLCGYPPLDLLSFPSFITENEKALAVLVKELPPDLLTLVGLVLPVTSGKGDFAWEKGLENTVVAVAGGRVVFRQAKTLLPTYDVFDERRYFRSATSRKVFVWKGFTIGIPICEDLWWEASVGAGLSQGNPYGIDPVAELADLGADLILSPSASPFYPGKRAVRIELMASVGRRFGIPVLYVNQVGGNDALVFDGGPLVTDKKGNLVVQGPSFAEGLVFWDTESNLPPQPIDEDVVRDLYAGLVLGLRDYVVKSGFKKVHLGLSGGIDSALVAVLAVAALGRENVRGIGMPSRYSSGGSVDDARVLASNLGIRFDVVPIEEPFAAFLGALGPLFEGAAEDVTEENIQARIRGVYLMALSNKTGSMLLTTGNKSELATGYCTLYGDMAGGLGVIGDVFKTEVYTLSEWINRDHEIIPWNTIRKPPSAELRPGQTDQDSLPPYEVLDRILKAYILDQKSSAEISAGGEDPALVRRVLKLTASAEYKRWQAPPVLKVSPVSFGMGRRLPLVRNLFELSSE